MSRADENSAELTRWLFDPARDRDHQQQLTVDLVFNGMSGLELPGGAVGWAFGGQTRRIKSHENVSDPLFNGRRAVRVAAELHQRERRRLAEPAAPTPLADERPELPRLHAGQPGAVRAVRPESAGRAAKPASVLGVRRAADAGALERLNFQAAARREEFSNDLGATVYKLSGKWNVWGPLSLRGSYGIQLSGAAAGRRARRA